MSDPELQDSTKIIEQSRLPEQVINDSANIQFMYRQAVIAVNRPEELPIYIGRDREHCHISVVKEVVSRQHCVIDYVEGRIVVKDTSTNGTYIKIGQAQEIKLSRQSYPLIGRGMIKLGEKFNDSSEDIIYFKCGKA